MSQNPDSPSTKKSKKTKREELKEISNENNVESAGKKKSLKRPKICKVPSEEAKGKANDETKVCNGVSKKKTKKTRVFDQRSKENKRKKVPGRRLEENKRNIQKSLRTRQYLNCHKQIRKERKPRLEVVLSL